MTPCTGKHVELSIKIVLGHWSEQDKSNTSWYDLGTNPFGLVMLLLQSSIRTALLKMILASGFQALKIQFLLPPAEENLGRRIGYHRHPIKEGLGTHPIRQLPLVLQQQMAQRDLYLVGSEKNWPRRACYPHPNPKCFALELNRCALVDSGPPSSHIRMYRYLSKSSGSV